MQLSEYHLKLYNFLESHAQSHNYSPSYDEMMAAMGKPRGSIQHGLKRLEDEGYIKRISGKARSIQLLKPASKLAIEGVLIKGVIAAGFLEEPFSDVVEEYLPISSPLLKPNAFALRVSGDSMIGANIPDGAYAIMQAVVDPQDVKNGTIVAAYVEGRGTTLKYFYRNGHTVVLKAANPKYDPFEVDTRELEVKPQGTLFGVWFYENVDRLQPVRRI